MKSAGGNMDEMLVKYLLGEATAAEQQEVQQWMAASDENARHYYQLKQVWDQSAGLAAASEVDERAAWTRMEQRIQAPARGRVSMSFRWVRVAAILVLLAGGGWAAYYMAGDDGSSTSVTAVTEVPVNKMFTARPATNERVGNVQTAEAIADMRPAAAPAEKAAARRPEQKARLNFMKQEFAKLPENYHKTKEFICNATPCPLEICIVQKVKCQDGEPSAISTCSILEPDESGQLRYKAFDRITKNCNATIEQITIRQVNTGETIVLNSDSKPATAEDFFSYITGQKKGDILAGIFHSDCDNQADNCGLTFDNNYGRLIMQ